MPYDNFDEWQRLFGSIEEIGKVGEIISLIPKLSSEETSCRVCPAYNIRVTYRSDDGYNNNEFWQNFRFFKLLVKYDCLYGLGYSYHTSYLLYWSLFEMEALKFVVSFLQNESHHLKPKWEI